MEPHNVVSPAAPRSSRDMEAHRTDVGDGRGSASGHEQDKPHTRGHGGAGHGSGGEGPGSTTPTDPEHAGLMDRIYRMQKPIYDLTRKYYLFGRDTLMNQLACRPGERVLEVGCGTARNLLYLHERYPQTRLFGLDVSREMLDVAERKVARRGLAGQVSLRFAYAEHFSFDHTFGESEPFDTIMFSYSLSMIPDWDGALRCALRNLKPKGRLAVVDFHDMARWPGWSRKLMQSWLHRFHVYAKPEIPERLQQLAHTGQGRLDMATLGGGYCYIAVFQKAD